SCPAFGPGPYPEPRNRFFLKFPPPAFFFPSFIPKIYLCSPGFPQSQKDHCGHTQRVANQYRCCESHDAVMFRKDKDQAYDQRQMEDLQYQLPFFFCEGQHHDKKISRQHAKDLAYIDHRYHSFYRFVQISIEQPDEQRRSDLGTKEKHETYAKP